MRGIVIANLGSRRDTKALTHRAIGEQVILIDSTELRKAMIRSGGQGDRISLYRVDRHSDAELMQQVRAEYSQCQHERIGENRALTGFYRSDTAAFSLEAGDLSLLRVLRSVVLVSR